jgi:hypothetical protein
MKGFPTKRDFYYIVTFLVLLLIFIFAGRLADNTQVVDYVGFAGTIVSILLAVIAIIYSFYQSSTYESATSKLDSSAQKIEIATTKLSNVSELEKVLEDFKMEVKEIRSGVAGLESIIKTVSSGVDSINKNWELTKEEFLNNVKPPGKIDFDGSNDFDKEYFKKVIENGGNLPFFVLELINLSHSFNIDFVDIKKWNRFYMSNFFPIISDEDKEKELKLLMLNTTQTYFLSFIQVGFVQGQFLKDGIELQGISKNLSLALNEKLEKIKEEEPDTFFTYQKMEKILREEK